MVTKTPVESVSLAMNNGCDLNCGNIFGNLLQAVRDGMVAEETIDGAVTNKQSFTPAARLAVRAVVRPHNHLDIRLFHACLKCREIGFIHILFCCLRVETVPDSLRT